MTKKLHTCKLEDEKTEATAKEKVAAIEQDMAEGWQDMADMEREAAHEARELAQVFGRGRCWHSRRPLPVIQRWLSDPIQCRATWGASLV